MSTERPPVDHLAEAKTAAGAMHTDQATMYALVSAAEDLRRIADQGEPQNRVVDVLDLAEHERQQRPILLTERQIAIAGTFLRHWATDQLGAAVSVGYSEQVARKLIRRINDDAREVTPL